MRRIATVILLTISLIMSLAITAYADDTNEIKSLDEIVAQPSDSAIQSDETESVNAPGSAEETSKLFNDLGKAADMSEASEEVKKPLSFLQKAVTYVVQILSYVATFGLTLRVVLDLIYIGLPFLRKTLANGHIGNPQAGAGGLPQQPGMMGGLGGMGGGLGGFGGMGGFGGIGGFGMNRGYGMGSPMYGNPMMGAGMGAAQQPGLFGNIQWVSNAALNATAGESTLGPDGKPVNPLKMYAKDMVIVLVITPIMLILAVSGALTQLGLLIGGAIAGAISNIGGSI